MPSRRGSRARRDRRPRRRGRIAAAVLGVLVVAVVAAGVWFARDALVAKRALDAATEDAGVLQRALTDGDQETASATVESLQQHTSEAREHTDGPLWAVASVAPFVGDSVEAVQVASRAVDDIAQDALPPILGLSSGLNAQTFSPEDGRFPLAEFAELTGPVNEAATVLQRTRERVDAIDADGLMDLVSGQMADLQEKVATAETTTSGAATALRLAPTMLGADEPQTYVLIFQNNAESRSTGGIPGAASLVRAENGELTFERQFNVSDLDDFDDDPVVDVTDAELRTYGSSVASDFRDINLTPDFPRTGEIAAAMVEESFGEEVDGVLSVDPVALSYLLRGIGSVRLPDGTRLTADNAAEQLLNTVYLRYPDGAQQDLFFAAAAERIFQRVFSGRGDARQTLAGLREAERERRLMLWSADESVQAELAGTRLSGALPEDTGQPRVGAYVSDATSSKMQYYLDWDTKVAATACSDDQSQTLEVTTTLISTAPEDVSGLPRYVTGTGHRADRGSQQINLRLFAPHGGEIGTVLVDGVERPFTNGSAGERPAAIVGLTIAPQERVNITVEMTSGPDQPGDTVVTTTPGARPLEQDVAFPSACG